MSVQRVQIDQASNLVVRLLDVADDPVTGVAYGDITVLYKKHGGSWAAKTVAITDWVEYAEGRYTLTFSDTELDTEGRFVYRVAAPLSVAFTGDVDVVDADATIDDTLEKLLNKLTTKVSVSDVKASKRIQDEAIEDLNSRCDSMDEDLRRLTTLLETLRLRI